MAGDSEEGIATFKWYFGADNVASLDDGVIRHQRYDDMCCQRVGLSDDRRWHQGAGVLTDMLLMAKADHLVHTTSQLAVAAKRISPKIQLHLVTAEGQAQGDYFVPDRKAQAAKDQATYAAGAKRAGTPKPPFSLDESGRNAFDEEVEQADTRKNQGMMVRRLVARSLRARLSCDAPLPRSRHPTSNLILALPVMRSRACIAVDTPCVPCGRYVVTVVHGDSAHPSCFCRSRTSRLCNNCCLACARTSGPGSRTPCFIRKT